MQPPPTGVWKSPQGAFQIRYAGELVEIKQECKCCGRKLHGILSQTGHWYEAEIKEATGQDGIVGYVRLKREGEGLNTQCRKSLDENWTTVCIAQSLSTE